MVWCLCVLCWCYTSAYVPLHKFVNQLAVQHSTKLLVDLHTLAVIAFITLCLTLGILFYYYGLLNRRFQCTSVNKLILFVRLWAPVVASLLLINGSMNSVQTKTMWMSMRPYACIILWIIGLSTGIHVGIIQPRHHQPHCIIGRLVGWAVLIPNHVSCTNTWIYKATLTVLTFMSYASIK